MSDVSGVGGEHSDVSGVGGEHSDVSGVGSEHSDVSGVRGEPDHGAPRVGREHAVHRGTGRHAL